MAIDTQNKRRSVLFTAIRVCYPVADGTVDSGDRAHSTQEYRGEFEEAAPTGQPMWIRRYMIPYLNPTSRVVRRTW